MPSRVVDGDAIARSQKLLLVPEKWRLHYPYWLTLGHPANGTFEVNPALIHRDLYVFLLPSVTLSDVKRIKKSFLDANLLKIWEQDGKSWGFFVGSNKPGRILPEKHRNRFKNLPPFCPGIFPEQTGVVPEGVGVGSGLGNGCESESDNVPSVNEEKLMSKSRSIRNALATVWQEVKNCEGLVIHEPHPSFMAQWRSIAEQCSKEALVSIFRMWAEEEGDGRDPRPLNTFVIAWPRFMDRQPGVVGFTPKTVDPEEQARIDEMIRKQRADLTRETAVPETEQDPNPEELFA